MDTQNPFRLKRDVVPVSYDLFLEPDLEKFTFKGRETVRLKASKPFSSVTLHAVELKITKAEIFAAGKPFAPRVSAKKIRFNAKFETVTIDFGKKIKPSEGDSLYLEFEGTLNDKLHGFYRTSYEVDGKKRWGAVTQFEATDARRAFPCWDEPDRKAIFKVTLRVPEDLTALSNMPVVSETKTGGFLEVSYEPTPVMSTYLLCFVVADLEYLEGRDKNGVLIRIYTTPGKKEQGRFALEVSKFCLPYFSEWFGIPYALPKCDMVALPDFASGAMENWGLITYRETALLVDAVNSSAGAKQRVAEVIDHELAHQWFGNLVTMEWWTDLWLNEGFASYMGPKAVDKQFPDWNIWSQYLAGEYLTALRDDSLKSSHPIEIPVKNPQEIREIFDHITYSKGSSVNRMLEHYLGEPAFRKGLGQYLKKYSWKNARTVDLWEALEKVSGKPVRAVMAGFTKKMGFPVVAVDVKPGKNKLSLKLTQKRFLFDGSADPTKFVWKVPVSVAAGSIKKTKSVLLDTRPASVDVAASAGDWIKLNPGQSGFYRAAYSAEYASRLGKAIEKGELPAIDTLGVVDDAFALARAGAMRTSSTLAVVEGCKTQDDYNVWMTAVGIMGAVENILPADLEKNFARFALSILAPAAGRSGWNAKPGDGHLDLLRRPLLIGRFGHYGDDSTIREASARFDAFGAGEPLDPNLRSAVYGIVAEKLGSGLVLEKFLDLYRSSKLQEEKVRVLRALTRFRDPGLVGRALDFALSPDVRSQDTYVVLAGFGGNKAARPLAWAFVKKNWKALTSRFSGGNVGLLSHIIEGSASGFTDAASAADVEKFLKSHRVPGTERAVRQTIEVIRSNRAWSRRDEKDVREWLDSR